MTYSLDMILFLMEFYLIWERNEISSEKEKKFADIVLSTFSVANMY